MSVVYQSGTFSTATAIGNPELSAPLPGINVNHVLRQRFQQNLADYAPLALNTHYPDAPFTDYVLVSEDDKSDITGLKTQWTRIYAKVPDSYTEPAGNFSYQFIGFLDSTGKTRVRFTRNASVVIQRDFYLVGPGGTYATSDLIPRIAEQRYVVAADPTLDVDYITDGGANIVITSPSVTQYLALISADAATADSYSIVVEQSTVTRWMGNIFLRETRRIKAI